MQLLSSAHTDTDGGTLKPATSHPAAKGYLMHLDGCKGRKKKMVVNFLAKSIYYNGISRFAPWGKVNPYKSFFLNLLSHLLDL